MTFTVVDFLLMASFGVGVPLYSALIRAPRVKRLPPEEIPAARRRTYRNVIVNHWTLAALLLLHWGWEGRPWSGLGLSAPSPTAGFWVSLAATVALLAFLAKQRRRVYRDPSLAKHVSEAIQHVGWLLPATRQELRWFFLVSLTAGVVEELFFRGLFLAWFEVALPSWLAWIVVTAWFGLGHAYQGLIGVVQTSVAGGLFLALRVLSGSLWLPMAFHAGFDAHSGVLVQWVRERADEPDPPETP